jgi:hypothetical protein
LPRKDRDVLTENMKPGSAIVNTTSINADHLADQLFIPEARHSPRFRRQAA